MDVLAKKIILNIYNMLSHKWPKRYVSDIQNPHLVLERWREEGGGLNELGTIFYTI